MPNQNSYNPVIDEITCVSIVKEAVSTMLEQRTLERKLDSIQDLLHEARSLNGRSKPQSTCYNIYSIFETLLFILLENAIKYTPDGKTIEVFFDEKNTIMDVTYCQLENLLDRHFEIR